MPISDYASAFFFDRRNRVTLKGFATRSLAICKVRPSIDPHQRSLRVGEVYKTGFQHSASKITDASVLDRRLIAVRRNPKRKSPAWAGLFDEYLF
jgi:hypothetical protein